MSAQIELVPTTFFAAALARGGKVVLVAAGFREVARTRDEEKIRWEVA